MSDAEGAMAEPLAVALHAAHRAGARHVVATDLVPHALRKANEVGTDEAIDVSAGPAPLARFAADKGHFDALFEASGNPRALVGGLDVLRPRGVIVQLGLGGAEASLPLNTIVAKEFERRGAFRFHEECATAVALINQGLVDLKPPISATLPFRDAARAFALAADRSRAMTVLLDFE